MFVLEPPAASGSPIPEVVADLEQAGIEVGVTLARALADDRMLLISRELVVIADLPLAETLDLIARIHTLSPRRPIIAIGLPDEPAARAAALDHGALDAASVGTTAQELAARIRSSLRGATAPDPGPADSAGPDSPPTDDASVPADPAGATDGHRQHLMVAAIIIGIALVLLALLSVTASADALPAFIPGHESGSSRHHIKHGIAAFLLGVGAFVIAWFQAGPRRTGDAE